MTAGDLSASFLAFSALGTACCSCCCCPALAARRSRRALPDHADDARPGREHGRQLLDDHDLAGLCRRIDAALPDATGRSGGAELPRRRGRPGGRASPSSAASPASVRRRSATSGWTWSARLLWVLLPLSLVGSLLLVWQGVPLNLAPYTEAQTLEGRPQTHRPGPGRRPGVHQEPGHQRRRLLQRQRRPPLCEPDAAGQLPRAAGHRRAACVAADHVRPHGPAGRAPAGCCWR